MSRIPADRLGYSGFDCCVGPPTPCWEPPSYFPMNGEGALCTDVNPENRFLNFPRKLEGEASTAPKYEQFYGMKADLALIYVPAGMIPDPVLGTYINLYQICMDNLLTAIFDHACFPLNVCNPSEYIPGYLDPPIPFISFESVNPGGGGGDPGMEGIEAVTAVRLGFNPSDELCVEYDLTSWTREPGIREVVPEFESTVEDCVYTTDCPE